MRTVGIISTMQEEIVVICRKMKITKTTTIAMIDFHVGEIDKQKVVLARVGTGPVNAAICTQILIDHFKIAYIISTGVAEGLYPPMNIGDIIISADSTGCHKDVIRRLIEAAKNAAEKAKGCPEVYVSKITSNNPVYYAEMEGPAMGKTCYLNKIPFIIIRIVSDKVGQIEEVNNYDFVRLAARKTAFIIEKMIKEN